MFILEDPYSVRSATVIDVTTLASSSFANSLQQISVADSMVFSFCKMSEYHTCVCALIMKKSFLAKLEGNQIVNLIHAPGSLTLHAKDLNARFEVSCSLSCLIFACSFH